jgi:hypothetical protein
MLVRRRLPMMVTPKIELRRIQVSVICSLLGYLNQNFRDSMFDFLVLIISKSRVLFDDYSAACIQASQLASSTLQSLNKLIADTTQFELVSFDRSAYREGGAHGRRRSRCAAYTSTCYDARSLDTINTDAATRAEQLIGRERLDHRRHALDAAANAPLVGAEKLVDKLVVENMDTRSVSFRFCLCFL